MYTFMNTWYKCVPPNGVIPKDKYIRIQTYATEEDFILSGLISLDHNCPLFYTRVDVSKTYSLHRAYEIRQNINNVLE